MVDRWLDRGKAEIILYLLHLIWHVINIYSISKGDLVLGKQLDDNIGKESWKKGIQRKC